MADRDAHVEQALSNRSIAIGMLQRILKVPPGIARYGTLAAIAVGLAAMLILRNRPRAAFTAAILTTIYSSPVVLSGNFALLVAVAAPWVLPRPPLPAETTEPRETARLPVNPSDAPTRSFPVTTAHAADRAGGAFRLGAPPRTSSEPSR